MPRRGKPWFASKSTENTEFFRRGVTWHEHSNIDTIDTYDNDIVEGGPDRKAPGGSMKYQFVYLMYLNVAYSRIASIIMHQHLLHEASWSTYS